jgi:hypothetical protein
MVGPIFLFLQGSLGDAIHAAVAVLAIIRSKTNAFPLSTIIIEQYRPPIDKFIIGACRCLLTVSLAHLSLQKCPQV